MKSTWMPALAAALLGACLASASTPIVIAPASGGDEAYLQITSAGYHTETPDCGHKVPHISVRLDSTLGRCVLAFVAHRDLDDDRCGATDRQRTEIRLNDKQVVNGVACTHTWKFKLDKGFQASPNFCHIHQIKAEGGDADAPMWTLTPRSGPEEMQVIYSGSSSGNAVRATVPLAPFKGAWASVTEHITFGSAGKYSILITGVADGKTLLSYSTNSINNARSGASLYSPKFGIYRSLDSKSSLRDETVLFADICRAIGETGCPSDSSKAQTGIAPLRPRAGAGAFLRPAQLEIFDLRGRYLGALFKER